MIDIGKIQTNSAAKDTKEAKDLSNQANVSNNMIVNSDQMFDCPPGYERFSKSSFQSDFSFPPGFGKTSFAESLPANFAKFPKPRDFNYNVNNSNNNNDIANDNNEQLPNENFQKFQSDSTFSVNSTSVQEQPQQLSGLNQEASIVQIPSFATVVYGTESYEPFQPHPKPDSSKYEKLVLCANLSSIQSLKQEKEQIESMISDEYLLCKNKISNFINEFDQRNRSIENTFQDLSQKIGDCTDSHLNKKKFNLHIDEVVDTRNEVEIEKFLRENSSKDNSLYTNNDNNESNINAIPKQETILDLLSIFCRIYKRDKELTLLWTKKILSYINTITDSTKLKPILLEIKRVMCSEAENSDESKDILTVIDSKL
ncbi:hypothetical protein M9Y10_038421 [Tritrichomonas musculus]|uniref:Uncharacterized protein n=1 Tax=Tritrichomonas musculus TaxID=1915356 RepID=A0ABR2K8C9_9EUKA